jgi:hypothetical protein
MVCLSCIYVSSLAGCTCKWKVCICWFTLHNCITMHRTKKTKSSLYVFDKWGKILSHKKMYIYSKKMFTRRAKPIQITGDSDNQRPDNWSSTVVVCGGKYGTDWRIVAVPRSESVYSYVSSVHYGINNNKTRFNFLCVLFVRLEWNNTLECGSVK